MPIISSFKYWIFFVIFFWSALTSNTPTQVPNKFNFLSLSLSLSLNRYLKVFKMIVVRAVSLKSEVSVFCITRSITVLELGKIRNGALYYSSEWKTQVGVGSSLAARKVQVYQTHGIVPCYIEYLLTALIDARNDHNRLVTTFCRSGWRH